MSFKIVVVGGNAAGAKAASAAKRFNPEADVTMIERSSVISFSACGIPYYVSNTVPNLSQLVSTPDGEVRDAAYFRNVKGVEVVTGVEAVGIDRAAQKVSLFGRNGVPPFALEYDRLILATGSSPDITALSSMGCPNILAVKGVEDAVALKDKAVSGSAACIVGGGLAGLEVAEALHQRGMQVTILERHNHLLYGVLDRDMADFLQKSLEEKGIKVLTSCQVAGFDGTTRVETAITTRGEVPADLVVLAPGVLPNVTLAEEAGLAIGVSGAIAVDERMQTSDPNIYACGDCCEAIHLVSGTEVHIPRGSTANKQARVAGINAAGGAESFPGILGTTIIKALDVNAGKTGLSEIDALTQGFDVETVHLIAYDRPHFFPDAKAITLKLVAERETGRLLGVQAVGSGVVDKRIDVAATALTFGATVRQLAQLDLAYAPPYAAAMDNVITAADIMKNKLADLTQGIAPAAVLEKIADREAFVLLDVRSPAEHAQGVIEGSTLIPLGTLRASLDTLPKEREIVVICQSGLRAYEAQRILAAAGFAKVSFMEGGLLAWPQELTPPSPAETQEPFLYAS